MICLAITTKTNFSFLYCGKVNRTTNLILISLCAVKKLIHVYGKIHGGFSVSTQQVTRVYPFSLGAYCTEWFPHRSWLCSLHGIGTDFSVFSKEQLHGVDEMKVAPVSHWLVSSTALCSQYYSYETSLLNWQPPCSYHVPGAAI